MSENSFSSNFNIFDTSLATIKDSSSNLSYFFRYNIVTSDGIPITEWSTVNQLNQNNVSNILDGFVPTYSISSVESGGTGINVKWTLPDSLIGVNLDIYFSWCYDSSIAGTYTTFEYTDTVISNGYYIKIPTGANFVKFAVQVPTNIKIINSNALLFQSTPKSTLPILDGGQIL